MAEERQEDLSQLKGPLTGWELVCHFGAVLLVLMLGVVCLRTSVNYLQKGTHGFAEICAIVGIVFLVTAYALVRYWYKRNHQGHKVWWCKDEAGKWRVTTNGYPGKALGLVIEVHVRAKPTFRIMWGTQGWWCVKCHLIIGRGWDGFLANFKGELVAFSMPDKIPPELSEETVELLCNIHGWRIVPRDAGRVLRFEDQCGSGMEIHSYSPMDQETDLEEILRAPGCASYRFIQRIGVQELRGACDKLREAREQAWQWLCELLTHLREQVKGTSRPPAKIVALEAMGWILTRLLAELPQDYRFRQHYGVSVEELESVQTALAAEIGKDHKQRSQRQETRRGRGEDKPAGTEGGS